MAWTERNEGLIKKWWQPSTVADGDIVAAYQAIGSTTLADSYVNLVNPGTNDAAPGIAPTWANDIGWIFNNSAYLTTGIIPTSSYTLFVHAEAIQVTTGLVDSLMGQQIANGNFFLTATLSQTGGVLGGTLNYQWGAFNAGIAFNPGTTTVRWTQTLASNKVYLDSDLRFTISSIFTASPIAMYLGARNVAGVATDPLTGRILACAIYNRELTASEVEYASLTAHTLTKLDDPTPNVNYITQQPSTRHLGSPNHELFCVTDNGVFQTLNGGRQWSRLTLPDPSNVEFGDNPAATVDELTFHYIDYDPTDTTIIYVMAAKASESRIWVYKSTDSAASWTSRGVLTS